METQKEKIEIELPRPKLEQIKSFCQIANLDLKEFLEKMILDELITLKSLIENEEPTIIEDYFSGPIFPKLKERLA